VVKVPGASRLSIVVAVASPQHNDYRTLGRGEVVALVLKDGGDRIVVTIRL
jgi:hypothetical protein